jgi:hypothetical protein
LVPFDVLKSHVCFQCSNCCQNLHFHVDFGRKEVTWDDSSEGSGCGNALQ